jgi:hypothetical protein
MCTYHLKKSTLHPVQPILTTFHYLFILKLFKTQKSSSEIPYEKKEKKNLKT